MSLAKPVGDDEDRLRPADWRDKYRWPDPVDGWSGALAGYPPNHPIRGGAVPKSVPKIVQSVPKIENIGTSAVVNKGTRGRPGSGVSKAERQRAYRERKKGIDAPEAAT